VGRSRIAALLAAGVAATLLAGACASEDPRPAPSPSSPPPALARPVTSPSPSSPVRPGGDLTLAFAGDVHFTGRAAALLDDPATAVGPIASVLRAADLAMVNLETAVTERGAPEPKEYTFRAPATAFDALVAAGVDVTTMANNHGMDYGRAGLADTLAAAQERDHPVVGVGRDAASAYRAHVAVVRGTRVAVLGLNDVPELDRRWRPGDSRSGVASARDLERSVAAVRAARDVADVVVVFLHWNQESNPCPSPRARALARTLAEAGADVLVGSHAHVLLGDGWLGSTYVAYGLGNFVWYASSRPRNTETGVLTLTLRGRRVVGVRFTPARISSTGRPLPATGADGRRIAERFAELRSCTGLADGPS